MAPHERNDLTIYNDRTQAWWDHRDPIFRPLHNLAPARWQFFEAQLPLQLAGAFWQGQRVVDVGCGGGYMSELMARQGARVLGVDIAAGALNAARTRAREQGFDLTLFQCSADALPCPSGSMDVAVCTDVLVHVPNPEAVVREIGRVLRPGGLFLFSSIHRTWISRLVMITLGEDLLKIVHRGTHDPKRFIRPEELNGWLRGAGLEPRALQGIGPTGFSRRSGLQFGRWPSIQVMYQGAAVKRS